MLITTMTFEFVLENGEHYKGASLWTKTGPEDKQPEFNGSQIKCDLENVDSILLSDGRIIKVFWAKEVFGKNGDPLFLMKSPIDLALIQTFEGQTLIGRSDPTEDGRIGLTIANERNKVLFTGEGDLVEISQPVKSHQLIAGLQQIYRWRRSSPSACAHCNPYIRKDSTLPRPHAGGTPDGGPPPDAGPPP